MADAAGCAEVGDDPWDAAFHYYRTRLWAAFFAGGAKVVLVGEAVAALNNRDLGAGYDRRRFSHGLWSAWYETTEKIASG